jgi:hypothetical protein
MRRVRGAGRVFDEKRFAGRRLVNAVQIINGIVGHSRHQVPTGLAFEWIDLRRVAKQIWLPLVSVAADKAVEIFEAHSGGPLIERPHLAGGERRRVMILAEPRRGVAVIEQNPSDSCLVLGDDAVVARESRGLFRDHAEAGGMMVAPGNQRSARRRAERGGVNVIVAQAVFRYAIHRRCRDDAAERARDAETGIVRDDKKYVRRLLRRHNAGCPPIF